MRSESTTTRDNTDEPASPTTSAGTTPVRRLPLPAVKGTMGGIESPRRDLFSPASTLRASEPYSPAPSTHGGSTVTSRPAPSEARASVVPSFEPAPPVLVFRADPRLTTCFESLPEGAEEVKAKFGLA